MIDWIALLPGALWITGLALVLAVFSWCFYAASLARTGLRAQLASPGFSFVTSLGLTLVMLGLALRKGGSLWMAIIWLALALGFLTVAWLSFRAWRRQPADS